MLKIFSKRDHYKPFDYPELEEVTQKALESYWLPDTISLLKDIQDFNKISEEEKELLKNVLRFFTKGEVIIGDNYMTRLCSAFKLPEIQQLLSVYAYQEVIHTIAYNRLNEALGLEEDFHKKFADYEELKAKSEYLNTFSTDSPEETLNTLAVFSGLMEHTLLFSSFAIIMNFCRRGLFQGINDIISYSIRDEAMHSEFGTWLFNKIIEEDPSLKTNELIEKIQTDFKNTIWLEDIFIDRCLKEKNIEGISDTDLKQYIRYRADMKLKQLRLNPIYNVSQDPLPWFTIMYSGRSFDNFFERKVTEYSQNSVVDDFNSFWSSVDSKG